MKGITLCADCAYYNMKKHKCTRGCKIDPDVSKGENPGFYVDCPLPDVEPLQKWIACSERLPEEETDVIAVIDGCSREAFYSDNSFICLLTSAAMKIELKGKDFVLLFTQN